METQNIFRQVHRIERVMLYETAISLQLGHLYARADLETIAGKVNAIILLTTDYMVKQEAYVLQAIDDYEPSVSDIFRQEHKTAREQIETLAIAVEDALCASEGSEREAAGRYLEHLFTQFLRAQLRLMGRKEKVLNPILSRYFNQDLLTSLQRELILHDDCQLSLIQVAWIIKTMEEEELIDWLRTVEKKASSTCMQTLLAAAEEQMEVQRFDKLSGALTEGALVA